MSTLRRFAVLGLLLAVSAAGVAVAKPKSGPPDKAARADHADSGAADESYQNRAYPATAIGFQQTQNSLKAARKIYEHTGVKFPAPWKELGPFTPSVAPEATLSTGRATTQSGRITAMAVDPNCGKNSCRLYVAAAGGGVWRADNALALKVDWKPISDGLDSNAIGSLLVDPSDPSGKTIYAGTGEENGSTDSEAGVGLYRSTDGGDRWTLVAGSVAVAKNRSIGAIAVEPTNAKHIFIGTAVARHGSSSVVGGRVTPPGSPQVGLYESTDAGNTFALAFSQPSDSPNPSTPSGEDSLRGGITDIQLDPSIPGIVYVSLFGYGLWRRGFVGDPPGFQPVFTPHDPNASTPGNRFLPRYPFALAKRTTGQTRIYLGEGTSPSAFAPASFWRVDNAGVPAATLNASWTQLSSPANGTPGFGSFDFCQEQCLYDAVVASPPGKPDTVWLGGEMNFDELFATPRSNGRAVMRSADGGVDFTDMSQDVQIPPEATHPDVHAIVFDPANPDIAFIGSDGGVVRTSGQLVDHSGACDAQILSGADLTDCRAWLSAIPSQILSLNDGLRTLQFQSVSANPTNTLNDLLGGTQDNGTWAFGGKGPGTWLETVGSDGGQSGYDAGNQNVRYHTYSGPDLDVNFHGSSPGGWDYIGDPLASSGESSSFYMPLIADPAVPGTAFAGLEHVWRTTDNGGNQADLDQHCNELTGDFAITCGDWQQLSADALTSTAFGPDKLAAPDPDFVGAVGRAPSDSKTLWASTRAGRVFISRNADAADPSTVAFVRVDSSATPTRFVSGIAVDPTNPLHAIVSFSGYDAYATAAGTVKGHVFDVRVTNPSTGAATWKDISYDLGDQPVTAVVFDQPTGDIYVGTDFGVDRLPGGGQSWIAAANGLPLVAVYGLTLAGGKEPDKRVLYAATHGRGIWLIKLPNVEPKKSSDK